MKQGTSTTTQYTNDCIQHTVFDLISENALISGHPHFLSFYFIILLLF